MRWLLRRRRAQASCERDAHYAEDVEHMNRALTDAKHLGRAAEDLHRRAEQVSDQFREVKRVNHVAEAVVESIRRRARHP